MISTFIALSLLGELGEVHRVFVTHCDVCLGICGEVVVSRLWFV